MSAHFITEAEGRERGLFKIKVMLVKSTPAIDTDVWARWGDVTLMD